MGCMTMTDTGNPEKSIRLRDGDFKGEGNVL